MLTSLTPLKLSTNLFFISVPKSSTLISKPTTVARFAHLDSAESNPNRLSLLADSLQSETLEILEWTSVCNHLSALASTTMGFSAAHDARIPFGKSISESQKLLDQTAAAVAAIAAIGSPPSDFRSIEDISGILNDAVLGKLLTVNELGAVRRTLIAAKALFEKLKALASKAEEDSNRYLPLLEILEDCDFHVKLERTIGLCIDCEMLVIRDTASEDLEIIRSEKKRNMERLDVLLKEVSTKIFKAGGIDSPLVTKRRARMCVGVRAGYKYMVRSGLVLDASSSGATYFVEPGEAVELNNMEVRLSNAEKAEEIGILSFLTSEIAKSEAQLVYLLDRIVEVDLAFARAAYARRMNGVCPIISSMDCMYVGNGGAEIGMSVDIEGIQHPLLLESSLKSLSCSLASGSRSALPSKGDDVNIVSGSLSSGVSDFPVPIDIKIGYGTRVVVISGPNTGGKTASMKTLGLASLMSKAGMYLPAKNCPKLPWFDLVLADIGDQQSLEQSLSTFSGHISRICNILEVTSKESLILIDEIGSGTDPSEGVALSTSILQYLKDRVNLAVVTTHYADLSLLKEKDHQFENAAMEFSSESLQPTYRVLWGSIGDSNALSIAKSIGFNQDIIERAHKWVERLRPEKQQERKGQLYQSLLQERNRLESQAKMAASLHSETRDIYHEIQYEAEDLDMRKRALMAKETLQVREEVKTAKSQLETVLQEFDNRLKIASADKLNLLIKKSEAAVASIIEAHSPDDAFLVDELSEIAHTPQYGEQVYLKGLGDKIATVVEAPGDDGTILVQYGKLKVRLKNNEIRAIPGNDKNTRPSSVPRLKVWQSRTAESKDEEVSYSAAVQTSKNTVDLRGMRVEEASYNLDMAIAARESQSVLFVVHGMGTGAVKERALEILKKHPRVAKYEAESPMNYGCTVAYIK